MPAAQISGTKHHLIVFSWCRNPPAEPGLRQREGEHDADQADHRPIWRGRTRRDVADRYEPYIRAEGIPPIEQTALGVQLFREDREDETWFTTISYWPSLDAMTAFTKGNPTKVHHLDRDHEFLIELPERIQVHHILVDKQGLR